MYYDLAGKISDRMRTGSGRQPTVTATGGSVENLKQLLDKHADVALMQESTVRADPPWYRDFQGHGFEGPIGGPREQGFRNASGFLEVTEVFWHEREGP
jgi:hypothetical protein